MRPLFHILPLVIPLVSRTAVRLVALFFRTNCTHTRIRMPGNGSKNVSNKSSLCIARSSYHQMKNIDFRHNILCVADKFCFTEKFCVTEKFVCCREIFVLQRNFCAQINLSYREIYLRTDKSICMYIFMYLFICV